VRSNGVISNDLSDPSKITTLFNVILTQQELISRLDSQTLCSVNVLGLLVFSNNMNGISHVRDIKRQIIACP